MDAKGTPETGRDRVAPAPEKPVLAVHQPEKIGNLLSTLELIDSFSEKMGDGHSGDWSGSGSQGTTSNDPSGKTGVSPRDQALANLPVAAAMQKEITKHIQEEVKALRKEVRRVEKLSVPGSAHRINLLYARIRRLNGLVSELWDASYEVVKRLFVKIFIDKQTVI